MNSKNKNITSKKSKNDESINKKATTNKETFPTKVFVERNSMLTDLFENKHIAVVYNICICLFICTTTSRIAHEYFVKKEMSLGIHTAAICTENIKFLPIFWISLFLLSLFPYYLIKFWGTVRKVLQKNSTLLCLWDSLSLVCFVLYLFGMFFCGTKIMIEFDFKYFTALIAVLELARFVMQVYAFGRECIPRLLNNISEKKSKLLIYPTFSQYVYFSFAPTFVYRDKYPRSSGKIRWWYVFICFTEIVAGLFLLLSLEEWTSIKRLVNYGLINFTLGDIITIILSNAHLGLFSLSLIFYIVLHSWCNAWAEMLNFADRGFYRDWWTSVNYLTYYKRWNVVVHDWLFIYVYKDIYEFVLPKHKNVAKILTLMLSALYHEYLVIMCVGFYVPLFMVFQCIAGPTSSFIKIRNNFIGNVFILYTLGLGVTIIATIAFMEHFARLNCVINKNGLIDYLTPKILLCYK